MPRNAWRSSGVPNIMTARGIAEGRRVCARDLRTISRGGQPAAVRAFSAALSWDAPIVIRAPNVCRQTGRVDGLDCQPRARAAWHAGHSPRTASRIAQNTRAREKSGRGEASTALGFSSPASRSSPAFEGQAMATRARGRKMSLGPMCLFGGGSENIASYVVARIFLTQYSGKYLGNSDLVGAGRTGRLFGKFSTSSFQISRCQ